MQPVLLLIGGAFCCYFLWQTRRWLLEIKREVAAGPRRLEAVIDELVATAEGTSAVVAEKTEALENAIARADLALANLKEAMEHTAAESRTAPNSDPAAPDQQRELTDLHLRVYSMADLGEGVTSIARRLSITKGEVQFILGLRRMN